MNTPPSAPETSQTGHPLGRIFLRTPRGEMRRVRLGSLVWFVAMATIFGLALAVKPASDGLGTHTQFGLPACSWPSTWGIPCPTCGFTTAFALAARGQWFAAWGVQPAGGLAAGVLALLLLRSVAGLVTGRTWQVNWYRVRPLYVALGAAGAVLLGWGYKILVMRGYFG